MSGSSASGADGNMGFATLFNTSLPSCVGALSVPNRPAQLLQLRDHHERKKYRCAIHTTSRP